MGKILKGRDGSILIVAVVVVMMLAGLCTALLIVSSAQSRSTVISEKSIRALYVAEAGINEALARISSKQAVDDFIIASKDFGVGEYAIVADFKDYATPTIEDDRWFLTSVGTNVKVAGGQTIQAFLDPDVDNNPGFVDPDVAINPACPGTVMMKGIYAVMAPRLISPFTHALFGDMDVAVGGSVFADSYDSELGTGDYADQYREHFAPEHPGWYAEANGDIGSNQNIALKGGVTIYGDVRQGPGMSYNPSGSPEVSGLEGIPMDETEDVYPVEYDITGINLDALPLADQLPLTGVHRFQDIVWGAGDGNMTINGDVTLYVDESFRMTGGQIIIPDGSSLTIYHGGWPPGGGPGDIPTGDVTFVGNGIANVGCNPTSFLVYSATTGEVNLGGGATFYGGVVVPNGTFNPGGNVEIYGSAMAGEIIVTGNPTFHYDEALGRIVMGDNGYEQVSWQEFTPVRQ